MKLLFKEHDENNAARTAVLMSGTGSNARAVMEYCRSRRCAFTPQLLLTDNSRCCAKELALEYDLPLETADIYDFYRQNGSDNIRLDSEKQRQLRTRWSEILFGILQKYDIELVLFAGFIPLTNLTGKLPCLNVHPGDLTVAGPDGTRIFAGLHYSPVEEALCRGYSGTRSSVILAQPYSGNGTKEMDTGPVIGISEEIVFKDVEQSVEELIKIRSMRQKGIAVNDRLREIADAHIGRMKLQGDHVVFPRAADDFARGRFAVDDEEKLFFNAGNGVWEKIRSIEYRRSGSVLLKE